VQQPSAVPTLQLLLQMHGTAMPGLAATLLSLLATAGEQAARQIAAQPGMLPALARLLQPSSWGSIEVNFAVRTFYFLTTHGMAVQRVAAEPAAAAMVCCVQKARFKIEHAPRVIALLLSAWQQLRCIGWRRCPTAPCSSRPSLQRLQAC
jgi:hypothetical protein